jgi:hypothetical protein
MTEYEIRTHHDDMPEGYVGRNYKWAHDEKEAVRLLLKKMPDKTGVCVFKRGGTGKILSTKALS